MRVFLLILFIGVYTAKSVSQSRVIHVLVALCDNKNQGIVPVPAKIGNGQDPANNLYWGCGYGVKTFMKKQLEWKLIKVIKDPTNIIYERVIFKHKTTNTYMIADAYNGANMKETVEDFLAYSAGLRKQVLKLDSVVELKSGGNANLICFVGHNGLMDFSFDNYPVKGDETKRDVAIFACASKPYFKEPLKNTGAFPIIWTTNLMCPEAYTLVALVNGWIKKDTPSAIHESVAQSYLKYHKCGIKGARGLFATGW